MITTVNPDPSMSWLTSIRQFQKKPFHSDIYYARHRILIMADAVATDEPEWHQIALYHYIDSQNAAK